jgi:hypothetical protein
MEREPARLRVNSHFVDQDKEMDATDGISERLSVRRKRRRQSGQEV